MRGAITSVRALNWLLAFLVGICTPRPPSHAGRANNFLSRSVIPCLSVTAGRNGCRVASSNGCKRGCAHEERPPAHKDVGKERICGLRLEFGDLRQTSDLRTPTADLSWMKSSMKDFDPKGAPRYLCPWIAMLTPEPQNCLLLRVNAWA